NFVNRNTRDVFSSINYNGSAFEICTIQTMGMFANFVTFDATFQVQTAWLKLTLAFTHWNSQTNINCTLPGNVDMMATALSTVTLCTDTDSSIMRRFDIQLIRAQTRATYLAGASAKLLTAFGTDFINQFLARIPTIPTFPSSLTTVYSELEMLSDMSFRYLDGTWSAIGGAFQGPRLSQYLR
ncbi:hypothetical protein FRC07_008261, partial [Ceratobasidium sp. 392]